MLFRSASNFSWPLAEGEVLKCSISLNAPLRAPINAGMTVGQAIFTVNGKEVGRVDLLCDTTVLPKVESAISIIKQGLPG